MQTEETMFGGVNEEALFLADSVSPHPKLVLMATPTASAPTENEGRGWQGYPHGSQDTGVSATNTDAKNFAPKDATSYYAR